MQRNPRAEAAAAAAAGARPDGAIPLVLWPPGHRRRPAAPGPARFAGDFQTAAKASLPRAGRGELSFLPPPRPCGSFLRRGPEPPFLSPGGRMLQPSQHHCWTVHLSARRNSCSSDLCHQSGCRGWGCLVGPGSVLAPGRAAAPGGHRGGRGGGPAELLAPSQI